MRTVVREKGVERPARSKHGDDKEDENVGRGKSVVSDIYMYQRGQDAKGRNLRWRNVCQLQNSKRQRSKREDAYECEELEDTPTGEQNFEDHGKG